MPLTTYPVGDQILKIPVTIDIPAVNTPFNPDAINPSITYTFNGMKALEAYGFHRSDFDKAQPPYPTSSSTYRNTGDFYLTGRHIVKRTDVGTEGVFLESAETYSRTAKPIAFADPASWASSFSENVASPGAVTWQAGFATADDDKRVTWEVDVPNGATLVDVRVYIDPAGLHAGLPSVMPKAHVTITDVVAGTRTNDVASDTTAVLGDYEDRHSFVVTVGRLVDKVKHVVTVSFTNEGGTNALSGLRVSPPIYRFTRTKIGEE